MGVLLLRDYPVELTAGRHAAHSKGGRMIYNWRDGKRTATRELGLSAEIRKG
jgi:hypothetical protein